VRACARARACLRACPLFIFHHLFSTYELRVCSFTSDCLLQSSSLYMRLAD